MSRLKPIIIILFIFTISLQFLRINIWDPDFWWHIATGREIIVKHSLPEKDEFTYTSGMEENKNLVPERENFILKQYWLSQIIFYLIYNYAGPKGIIILRSLLYVGIILIALWRMKRWSVSFPVSFIAAFILFMALISRLTGERPVLFTNLFSALVFFILEDFRDKRDRRIFLLLPLMLVWSNLHGGFLVGIVVIIIYAVVEGLKVLLKKTAFSKRELTLFYSAIFLAIGCSWINPTGWDAFMIAFSSKYKIFTQNIQEYTPPIVYYKEKLFPVNYWHLGLALFFPLILAIRNRRMDLTHIALLAALFGMSLTAMRFIVYYAIISPMIFGRELDLWLKGLLKSESLEKRYSMVMNSLTIAALVSVIFYMSGFALFKRPGFSIAKGYTIPVAAVDFIEKNRIEGNIFNYPDHGGYIEWRLYPWKKAFDDSRALNATVQMEFEIMIAALDSLYNSQPSITKGPLWERLLDHYRVNIVFLPKLDLHGTVLTIIFKLTEHDGWVPVYMDPVMVIFVRNDELNKKVIEKFMLSNDIIYNSIILESARYAIQSANPRPLMSLGETFYQIGRLSDAVTAYRYAMKRLPSLPVQARIDQIESEIKKTEKKP